MTARAGFWRRATRRRADLFAALLIGGAPAPAAASTAVTLSLPPATLDQALLALARATGADIISTEPDLRRVRTRPLSGRLTVRAALDRLLEGTGYRAVRTGGGYRIVAASIIARAPPRPTPAPAPAATDEVVVTASKQRVTLLRYPGTLSRIAGTPTLPTGQAAAPSDLGRTLPVIQSTQLGPGRNKVFVRGVADSSFNGTTLSTVSVYLDDVQLSASGPDPGLRLYDVSSVEVMEGPQGTLYGAGSIGGVVRLTSTPPDLRRVSGSASGGVSVTQSGAPGADVAGMVNLPLVPGVLAVRAVAYGVSDGGYLDDPARGARNVNRTRIGGGRLTAALAPGNGWRLELGGALQRVWARDGQYSLAGDGPLARRTVLAQPFNGEFRLARAVLEKTWDSGLRLVSATGLAAYDTAEVFDATAGGAVPATSRTDTDKLLLSHEMRLSRSARNWSWLTGVTLISDQSVLLRSAGALDQEVDVTGVRNVTRAASVFGEATATLLRDLAVTLGARVTIARVDSEPSQIRRAEPFVRGQTTRRIDPTIAASYRLAPGLAAFARHQTGFRTGGLAVARGIGRVANFDPDSINVNEVGLRRLRHGVTGLEASLSLSAARWTNIQADLLSRRGQPYTANVGDATIRGVEAMLDWRPIAGLTLKGSALYTENRVYGPIAEQSVRDNRRLPETPALGGHAEIAYAWNRERRVSPELSATLDYVGPSVLGTGDLLDTRQGGYALASAAGGVRWNRTEVSLRADNLLNNHADRFAFGNPMGLAARDQRTPLQPRTVRLGLSSRW